MPILRPFPVPALLPLVLLVSSCASTPLRKGTPATPSEVKAMLSAAKDPRNLFITVYRSKEGPVFADANRSHPGQADELDLESIDKTGIPIFSLTDDARQPLYVLLDLRSRQSWVDFDTALRLATRAIGPDPYAAYVNHLVDPTEGFVGVLETLAFTRQLQLEAVIVNVRPQIQSLGLLARNWTKPEPFLTLGLDALSGFKVVQLDLPGRKIIFSVDGGYQTDPGRLVASLPTRVNKRGLEVDAIVDGYEGPVHFDPAGRYAVAVPNPASTSMQQVTLGEYVTRNVPVTDADSLSLQSDDQPSIGYELLKDLVITLDNEKGRVYLELPPE